MFLLSPSWSLECSDRLATLLEVSSFVSINTFCWRKCAADLHRAQSCSSQCCTINTSAHPLLFISCFHSHSVGFLLFFFFILSTEWWLGCTATMLYDLQTSPLLFCCFSLYGFPQLPPPTQSSPAAVRRGLLREIMMSANCSISVLCSHCPGGKATLLK